MKFKTKDAYKLMHDGALALAQVESDGMRIDVKRMDRAIVETGERITKMTAELKEDEIWRTWKKLFGKKSNLGSTHQLGKILFEELGYEPRSRTKTGKPQVNEENLRSIDLKFIDDYLTIKKLMKLQSTYLKGIRKEVVDGFLRPSFNLHLTKTFRSSSNNPNFQNIPIRDKEIGKLIRSCFIPRDGHVLVEVDYGALEFRIAASFWKDKNMVEYASDPDLDIHRDMAAECYCMKKSEVTKEARFYAKNQFVFPTLYGSYYVTTARDLWTAMQKEKLKTADGVPLQQHMRKKGITQQNFESHIKKVEESLNERFATWSDRKEKWWNKYQKTGGFDLLTGFHIDGVYSKNQLMNTPIQGPAFHCLLWSLIKMVKWLNKKQMRSCVIGQIHDSIVADVHVDELKTYLRKIKNVMTVDVRKHYKWIRTPLEIEAEVAETTWFDKKEVDIP